MLKSQGQARRCRSNLATALCPPPDAITSVLIRGRQEGQRDSQVLWVLALKMEEEAARQGMWPLEAGKDKETFPPGELGVSAVRPILDSCLPELEDETSGWFEVTKHVLIG